MPGPGNRPEVIPLNSGDDPVWQTIRTELMEDAAAEQMLASFLHATVLTHETLEDALSFHLAGMLGGPTIHSMTLREVFLEACQADPEIGRAIREDILAVRDRDPACRRCSQPLLYFKGFHAIQS